MGSSISDVKVSISRVHNALYLVDTKMNNTHCENGHCVITKYLPCIVYRKIVYVKKGSSVNNIEQSQMGEWNKV